MQIATSQFISATKLLAERRQNSMKLPMKPDTDDRRTCEQCANLRGIVCSVARPGGVVSAVVGHRPGLLNVLQRCRGYKGE